MKIHQLEGSLSAMQTFTNPIIELEQYPTSAHLAARIAHTMHHTYDDISDKTIADLGCGTGMLSIACALLTETCQIIGVDVDPTALAIACDNMRTLDVCNVVDFLQGDVIGAEFGRQVREEGWVDVVVMNPPFGTKRKGIDMAFLQTAVSIARSAVYSMHKSATRAYIERKAQQWGVRAQVLARLKFDIGEMYSFHKAKSVDVEVDLWRFDTCGMQNKAAVRHVERPLDTVEEVHAKIQRNRYRGKGRKKKPSGYSRGSRG